MILNFGNWKIVFFGFLFLLYSFSEKKVLLAVIVSRHCDRTPFSTFSIPEFGVDLNKLLNQSIGKLTLLGEQQCYNLGVSLRSRYLDMSSPYYIKGINPVYSAMDYELISTSYDRTIRSGVSISMGLFPPYSGYRMDIPPHEYPLPGGITAVPYHSTSLEFDKMLLGFDVKRCPQLQKNRDNFFSSYEGQTLVKDFEPYMRQILDGTGLNQTNPVPAHANFIDVYYIWDYLLALKEHQLLPQHFIDEYWNVTRDVTCQSYYYQFRKSIIGKLGGGLFMGNLLSGINQFVKNEKLKQEMKNRRSSSVIPTTTTKKRRSRSDDELSSKSTISGDNWDANDGSNPKFIHYSAHDQTISVILSGLGMIDAYTSLRTEVGYGAALIFELWGDDSYNDLEMKIVYKDSWDGPYEDYKLPLAGEAGEVCLSKSCPFNVFSSVVTKEAVISDVEFCEQCGVPNDTDDNICLKTNFGILKNKFEKDDHKLKTYKGWLMALSILCAVFFVCCVCMCVPVCLTCITSDFKIGKKIREVKTKREDREAREGMYRKGLGGPPREKGGADRPSSWLGEEAELLSDVGGDEDEFLIQEGNNGSIVGSPSSPKHHHLHHENGEVAGEEENLGENGRSRSINYESTDYI